MVSGNQSFSGGGIHLTGDGFIYASSITGNTAAVESGGIALQGIDHVLRVVDSTFSGNMAGAGNGGGIYFGITAGNSTLEVTNSTFGNNTAPFQGRTIAMQAIGVGSSTTTILRNSIFASDSVPNLSAQTFSGGGPAVFESHGFNLASDNSSTSLNLPSDQNSANAGLEPLADNGGTTFTHALMGSSDALDGGNNGGSRVTSGQRGNGFARTIDLALTNVPGGDGTDIGAYEAQTEPVTDRIFASGFQ